MPNTVLQDMFLKRYSCRGHQIEQRSNCNFIAKNFDSCIDKSDFSSELKEKKKKVKSDKTNYRPRSIFSYCSKKYEKVAYDQLYQYFDNILFPSKCRFQKRYSAQDCVLILIEKLEEAVDNGNNFRALLTDSPKASNYLNYYLLVTKLYKYGFLSSYSPTSTITTVAPK